MFIFRGGCKKIKVNKSNYKNYYLKNAAINIQNDKKVL